MEPNGTNNLPVGPEEVKLLNEKNGHGLRGQRGPHGGAVCGEEVDDSRKREICRPASRLHRENWKTRVRDGRQS